MTPDEARRIRANMPKGNASLSADQFARYVEAALVEGEVEPERMRQILESYFGPLD